MARVIGARCLWEMGGNDSRELYAGCDVEMKFQVQSCFRPCKAEESEIMWRCETQSPWRQGFYCPAENLLATLAFIEAFLVHRVGKDDFKGGLPPAARCGMRVVASVAGFACMGSTLRDSFFFMLIELVHEVILRLRHEFDVKPWLEQTQLKVTVEKAAPSYAALMSLVPPHWQGHLRIDIEVDANGAARSILRGNTWSLRDKMDMMGYYENKQGEQLLGKEPGSSFVRASKWLEPAALLAKLEPLRKVLAKKVTVEQSPGAALPAEIFRQFKEL